MRDLKWIKATSRLGYRKITRLMPGFSRQYAGGFRQKSLIKGNLSRKLVTRKYCGHQLGPDSLGLAGPIPSECKFLLYENVCYENILLY